MRHLADWWEGQDIDPGSGLSHITKAIAGLYVLRDAMMNDMWEDDRPPSVADPAWVDRMNREAGEMIDRYPHPKAPFTRKTTIGDLIDAEIDPFELPAGSTVQSTRCSDCGRPNGHHTDDCLAVDHL